MRRERYAGWKTPASTELLSSDLATIAAKVEAEGIDPQPRSGKQEILENIVNRYV